MFENTTIMFSKETAKSMMSQKLSDMFNVPLEVTALDMNYNGLEVKFGPAKENAKEAKKAIQPEQCPEEVQEL